MPCNTDANQKIYPCADKCVYASIPGSFYDHKTVTFDNSATTEDVFNSINKFIFDRISHHMLSVVTHEYFGYMINGNAKEYGYYIVNFTSEPYTLQEYVIIDGRKIATSEQ